MLPPSGGEEHDAVENARINERRAELAASMGVRCVPVQLGPCTPCAPLQRDQCTPSEPVQRDQCTPSEPVQRDQCTPCTPCEPLPQAIHRNAAADDDRSSNNSDEDLDAYLGCSKVTKQPDADDTEVKPARTPPVTQTDHTNQG